MKILRVLPIIVSLIFIVACSSEDPSGDIALRSTANLRPAVSVANAVVQEGAGNSSNLLFTVCLDAPANGYVNVNYATVDGTAEAADNDYIPAEGILTIDPGFTSALISIGVQGDLIAEGSETFSLVLTDPSANVTLGRSAATGVILNDDLAKNRLPESPRGIISTSGRRVPIDQDILDNPGVTGFMVLDTWKDIERAEGVFDWTHIDAEVARARAAGKVIRLAIHTGGDSVPDWVSTNNPQIKKVISYDKFTGARRFDLAYWDLDFIRVKSGFYRAIGDRYKDKPVIFAISAAMLEPNTGDWAFPVETDEQVRSYLSAGFTEQAFIYAYKALLDNAMRAFTNKYVINAVGHIPKPLADDQYAAVHEVLDYAYAKYGSRLLVIKGSLNEGVPDTVDLPENHNWQTMLRYSPNAVGQFLGSVTNDSGFKMNGGVPYDSRQNKEIFWSVVEKSKSYNLRWIEIWSIDVLNPELQAGIDAAAKLLGTASTPPACAI